MVRRKSIVFLLSARAKEKSVEMPAPDRQLGTCLRITCRRPEESRPLLHDGPSPNARVKVTDSRLAHRNFTPPFRHA